MRCLFPLFAVFVAASAAAEIDSSWTTPLPPFQIADNLYYVGSQDLAAFLVTTLAGNILINANLDGLRSRQCPVDRAPFCSALDSAHGPTSRSSLGNEHPEP